MKRLSTGAVAALALGGCDRGQAPSLAGSTTTYSAQPAASASASGRAVAASLGVPAAIAGDPGRVVEVVNPKHEKPYAGPTGTLKGIVRIEGDPPPDTNLKFPDRCWDAVTTYGKLFRVGLDKALADAMVAVTGYAGYVPASSNAATVAIRGCAASRRTIVMTFGQTLDVSNRDKVDSYLPTLDGARSPATIVAVPSGAPVKLYAQEPGRYMLRDLLPSGLVADVFVLKYATHDVTGLDGRYAIKGIPVGKVHIDVYLPVIAKTDGRAMEIREGDNTLDVTLRFDASKDIPGAAPVPSSSVSSKARSQESERKVPR